MSKVLPNFDKNYKNKKSIRTNSNKNVKKVHSIKAITKRKKLDIKKNFALLLEQILRRLFNSLNITI